MGQDDDIKKLTSEYMTEGKLEPLRYGFVNAVEVENTSGTKLVPTGVVPNWPGIGGKVVVTNDLTDRVSRSISPPKRD